MKEQTNSATKTIGGVMLLTLLGKVLGLYRDRLLAVHYSVTMEANAFFTASRIPRVFFDAVFASAIASCFIPVFAEYLEQKGRKEALRFAGSFVTLIALLTGGLTVLGMVLPQPLVAVFADYQDAETTALAVSLTRLLFPTVFFSGMAFSLVGVLQSQDHFSMPALMSTASNTVIIAYFFLLDSRFGIFGLACAYLLGWLLQGVILLPPLHRLDCRLHPGFDFRSEGMRKVLALMGPVMVSTWVQPINLVVNSRFGSRLYGGSGVSALEYSTNLYLVIAGVFILSITNVLFPRLSRLTAGGKETAFQETIRQSLHSSLFFIFPMSAGLMAVSRPLISFIYGGGEFDTFSVQITSTALFWLSLGMTGYAVQNILSRAYFARQEGKAPLIAGAVSILTNVVLCILLAPIWEVAGLAVASAASSTVYALLLLFPIVRQNRNLLRGLCPDLVKMAISALVMGSITSLALSVMTEFFPSGKSGELVCLGLCAALGVAVYFLLTLAQGLEEARLVFKFLRPGKGG